MTHFIQIDENGFIQSNGARIIDSQYGFAVLSHLKCNNRIFTTTVNGQDVIVEAFNSPLVAQSVYVEDSVWKIQMPYNYLSEFKLEFLCVDQWDRFQGRTPNDLPFVFSRQAQMQFFDLLDRFDDDSISFSGQTFTIPTLNAVDKTVKNTASDINATFFWEDKYNNWESADEKPGWELNGVTKPLTEILPQIKIPKSKICVLGCGTGHDAAYLARQGHIVTAVDFSSRAITRARNLYGESSVLKFYEADAFEIAKKNIAQFDIVFEHTFFCAIDPDRRDELIKAWCTLLAPRGHLLGLFFAMDRKGGPPFGASEWEIREHLKKRFQLLYWTRWKTSIPSRLGQELIVYAQKKEGSI